MNRRALVTLAIGEDYATRFEALCRSNWTAYAQRHGLDVVAFTEPLDASARARGRSPAWQKCLILGRPEVAAYERVAWVDSDIVINPAAPCVFDGVPADRIGATDEHCFPDPKTRAAILEAIVAAAPEEGEANRDLWRAWESPSAWHEHFGLPGGQAHIVQTGVMVLSPQHRGLLEHVYSAYEDRGSKVFNYEMRPLSHEIQRGAVQHWIDPRFNALVWWLFLALSPGGGAPSESQLRRFLSDIFRRSHFLHFAGSAHLMPLLGPV